MYEIHLIFWYSAPKGQTFQNFTNNIAYRCIVQGVSYRSVTVQSETTWNHDKNFDLSAILVATIG